MSFKKLILVSLLSFAIVPILLFVIIFSIIAANTAVNLEKDSLRELARSVSASVSEIMELQKLNIELMTSDVNIKMYIDKIAENLSSEKLYSIDSEEINKRLADYSKLSSHFQNVVIASPSGIVLAGSIDDNIGIDLSAMTYFQDAVNSKDVIVGNTTISLNDISAKSIPIGYAVRNSNEIVCVIVSFEPVDFLAELFNNVKIGYSGQIFMMDSESFVFYSSDFKYSDIYVIVPELKTLIPDYMSGIAPKTGDYDYPLGGIPRFYTYNIVENAGWSIVVRQDYAEINEVRNEVYVTAFVIVLFSFVIAVLAGLIISNKITKPILTLKEAFTQASAERVFARCEVTSKNEIGELVDSYNIMINYIDYYDKITGLLSRKAFMSEVHALLAESDSAGVFFIDLDNFKDVNDLYGHRIGDSFLEEIGKIIRNSTISMNLCARFGGDEFLIAAKGSKDQMEDIAKHLNILLQKPIDMTDLVISASASIGISMYPADGTDIDELIKNADIAMYEAKKRGRNLHVYYGGEMSNYFTRMNILKEITNHCIEKNELLLYYQPEIDVLQEKVIGMEALLRINAKTNIPIFTKEFIEVSESNGQILKIGAWVLETAFRFAKALYTDNNEKSYIAVNISPRQIIQKDFVSTVLDIAYKTGVSPENIQLEITESTIMEDIHNNISKLKILSAQGFTVAMDDFGTFYSSLSNLTMLPIHVLKIDKSFIDDICTDKKKQAVVKAIIQMSGDLGIKVIAEGVETEMQLKYLRENGCRYIQGYYYSKPLLPEDSINYSKAKNENMKNN